MKNKIKGFIRLFMLAVAASGVDAASAGSITKSSLSFTAAGGSATVDAVISVAWGQTGWDCKDVPYWLSYSAETMSVTGNPNSSGEMNIRITFRATMNPTVDQRTARVGIRTNPEQNIYSYLSISQSGSTLSIDADKMSFWLNGGAGNLSVNATKGTRWRVAADSEWLSLSDSVKGWGGSSPATVRFSVAKNNSGKTRTAKIYVQNATYYENTLPDEVWKEDWAVTGWQNFKSVTITQEGCFSYLSNEDSVSTAVEVHHDPLEPESFYFSVDGQLVLSETEGCEYTWQPLMTGNHLVTVTCGNENWESTFNVRELSFDKRKGPNPPTAKDNAVSITPVTRNFPLGGGGNAIIT